jgi:hypothetical protein
MNILEIYTHTRINCGAMGIAYIDQDFAWQHQIPLDELNENRQVEVLNRRPIESGNITHISKAGMKVHLPGEQLPMFVTKLGHYPIVIGSLWI